ncbi:hypothetical protein [Leptolyngbya sp. NIES-2104]|uniref:hypothetical protein n=1 Tax=Leptolyngbya sp. NIES-2104 TaxID=1552121 RepID=UPI0006ECCD5D|nr:hypothetical protein [Leptolyngbya sp. NIES-2104]GAP93568.1 hypothetical protein NIES2104_00740 [Leptolyngbya sp. NIES-2104]
MFEVDKRYVFDQNGNAIAVQIPIEQFERIESVLETFGYLNPEEVNGDPESDYVADEDLFEYVNGVLVVRAALGEGMKPEDIEFAVQQDREARDRKLRFW